MRLRSNTVQVSAEPATEPISTTEAKLHCRIDQTTEDTLIARLITVARLHCEDVARRKFITQTLTGGLECWPHDGLIELPLLPAQSITSITYVDINGNSATLSASVYGFDTKRGRIYLKDGQAWPTVQLRTFDPITVTWVAGYGAAGTNVPARYLQAILLMIGHLYENREAAMIQAGLTPVITPLAVDALLMTDRGY